MTDCGDHRVTRAAGATLVLLTLASGQFLMTLDSSVMNVSIATVAKDVGTTVTGIQGRDHPLHARDGGADDHRGQDRRDHRPQAAFAIGCVIYGCGSFTTAIAPSLPVLLFGWSFLEGVGAALILPAIVALVAGTSRERRPAAYGLVAAAGAIAVAVGPADRRVLHDLLLVALGVRRRGADRPGHPLLTRRIADAPWPSGPARFRRCDPLRAGLGMIVFGVLHRASGAGSTRRPTGRRGPGCRRRCG